VLYLNRLILINALLILFAAILHVQQIGFLGCEAPSTCQEMQLSADFGLTIFGILMLLGFFNCYRSDWAKKDLIFLGLVAAATLFAVKSYLSDPSLLRYTSSPLIYVEVISALAVLMSLVSILIWPWLIYKKRWKDIATHAGAIGVAILCLAIALYVDTSTLLYAT
jgi:hypothetical protein